MERLTGQDQNPVVLQNLETQSDFHLAETEQRNTQGYIDMLMRVTLSHEVRKRLGSFRSNYNPREVQEAMEAKSAYKRSLEELFVNPEASEPLVVGLERAMESLDKQLYEPLALRYGIGSRENSGMTLTSVAKLTPNKRTGEPVTAERVRQKVAKAERQLRHPSRAKYFWEFLPPQPNL